MTLREIYQALIDGKKLCSPNLPFDKYVHLVGDELMYDDGSSANIWFVKGKWSIYQEPRPRSEGSMQWEGPPKLYFSSELIEELNRMIDLRIKQAKLGK